MPVVVKVPLTLMGLEAVKFRTPEMVPGSVKGVLKPNVRSLAEAARPAPSVRLVPVSVAVPPKVTAPV